ncbi:DUF2345 domain-containing protein, partial [Neisseria zoodegmatis]
QMEQALSLAKSLNKAAHTAKNEATEAEEQAGRLNDSLKQLQRSGIIQSAPDGIATATPQSQLHTAGQHIHHISGGDTDISAGSNFTAHAVGSVNLFAQSNGAKLQANQGKVEIQAQNDEMQINALKDATITSSAGKVTVAAKDEILLTSGGAYIKIKDGNIELGCPKMVWVKCAGFQVMGPATMNYTHPEWPKTIPTRTLALNIARSAHGKQAFEGMPFKLYADGREIKRGVIDKSGNIAIEHQIPTQQYKLELANGEIYKMSLIDEYQENTKKSKLINQGFYFPKGMDTASAAEAAQHYADLVAGKLKGKNNGTSD